jgi:hypothetical protein
MQGMGVALFLIRNGMQSLSTMRDGFACIYFWNVSYFVSTPFPDLVPFLSTRTRRTAIERERIDYEPVVA